MTRGKRRKKNLASETVDPLRRRIMISNKARGNRSTEIRLRMALIRAGASGWTLHAKHLPGTPDFFFPSERFAIFVDGDFWHGNVKSKTIPKTREDFWRSKIEANRARDLRVTSQIKRQGIKVERFWESSIRSPEGLSDVVTRILQIVKIRGPQFRKSNLPA